jgi:hypothetical protein
MPENISERLIGLDARVAKIWYSCPKSRNTIIYIK